MIVTAEIRPSIGVAHRVRRFGQRRKCRQVAAHVRETNDLGVLRLQVEQVRLVRRRVPVADRLAHDQWHEAVLAGVERAGAHAAAGADPGDQDRVHAERGQRRGERRAEEGAGVLLGDHGLAGRRLEPFGEGRELRVAAGLEAGEGRHLAVEHAAVATARLVRDVRVQDRDAGRARDGRAARRKPPERSRLPRTAATPASCRPARSRSRAAPGADRVAARRRKRPRSCVAANQSWRVSGGRAAPGVRRPCAPSAARSARRPGRAVAGRPRRCAGPFPAKGCESRPASRKAWARRSASAARRRPDAAR